MNRKIAGLITAGLIILVPGAGSASAQSLRPRATPIARSKPSIGIFGLFDYSTISSPKSFDAVFGKHTATAPGVGVDAINLWNGLFVRIDGSQSKLSGERVVIVNSEIFKLGIPMTAQLTPIEFGAGWRFASRNPRSRIAPYVGASAVSLKYKETSSFADSTDNVDETYMGFGAFGGVDVRISRQVFGGVEGHYRTITITPGPNSAAASFDEKDFGGGVVRVRFGIRF